MMTIMMVLVAVATVTDDADVVVNDDDHESCIHVNPP